MKSEETEAGPNKPCEECGGAPAMVHVTQVVDEKSTSFHLCEKCATEKGLMPESNPPPIPLADFLAKMGGDEPSEGGPAEEDLRCPFCDLSSATFKSAGRLGCPQCYSTFEKPLRSLLRRIHGGTQHVGKVYLPSDPSAAEVENRLEGLKKKLQRAVESEDFERAALLRDEIIALEPAT